MAPKYILVTGATGFIGAHVVDSLLKKGLRVRGATRSMKKGQAMLDARPTFQSQLDFVQIEDFEKAGVFEEAVKGVDAVIHVASPFTYETQNNEKELILPAINGINSILNAAAQHPIVERVVITSSFASIIDIDRKAPPYFTYTSADWNPLTYDEAAHPSTSAVVAYRGSKKFAELTAWKFIDEHKPSFDIVTICPPMTFGPVVHPINTAQELNESNAMLWQVSGGQEPMPVARVPFWVDVRDLAEYHVQALLRPEVGGKRLVVAAPQRFSYGLAKEIIAEEFGFTIGNEAGNQQKIDDSYGLDGETAAKELGLGYRSFKECVVDLIAQVRGMEEKVGSTV